MRRLIAAYPTEKQSRTSPHTAKTAGVAAPAPSTKASGTMPTMAALKGQLPMFGAPDGWEASFRPHG